jgi:hypothetical protein
MKNHTFFRSFIGLILLLFFHTTIGAQCIPDTSEVKKKIKTDKVSPKKIRADRVSAFRDGYAVRVKNGVYAILDKDLNIFAQGNYDFISPIYHSFAIVRKNDRVGIIKINNNTLNKTEIIIDCSYKAISYPDTHGYCILTDEQGNHSVVNLKNTTLPPNKITNNNQLVLSEQSDCVNSKNWDNTAFVVAYKDNPSTQDIQKNNIMHPRIPYWYCDHFDVISKTLSSVRNNETTIYKLTFLPKTKDWKILSDDYTSLTDNLVDSTIHSILFLHTIREDSSVKLLAKVEAVNKDKESRTFFISTCTNADILKKICDSNLLVSKSKKTTWHWSHSQKLDSYTTVCYVKKFDSNSENSFYGFQEYPTLNRWNGIPNAYFFLDKNGAYSYNVNDDIIETTVKSKFKTVAKKCRVHSKVRCFYSLLGEFDPTSKLAYAECEKDGTLYRGFINMKHEWKILLQP